MVKGLVADIQRTSLHDGDGIRTTVFLKGCPLSCLWCHNPECISFEKEIMEYPEKCIGCGKCSEGCYSGAKVVCGKEMTAQEVFEQIILDKPYFADNGGVTVSGGEPMAQKEFAGELIELCKKNNINCAMETSLIYFDEEIFKKLDFVMADLKIWNDDLHKKYTGVSNKIIKENFESLNSLRIPIIARTPIIPDIDQELDKISEFLKTLENVKEYELLPYHPLGIAKQKALKKDITEFEIPSAEYMKELKKYAFIRRQTKLDAQNKDKTYH
ncbi:MAG: radical SAM protein [Clostridia bacterium]|nr:radical SAM protein [Clostridia bacterium]